MAKKGDVEYPSNKIRDKVNVVQEQEPSALTKPDVVQATTQPKAQKDLPLVVTKGTAKEHKPSTGERLRTSFLGGEVKTAATYVVSDVLLPALRNMVVDVTTKGVERLIWGDNGPKRQGQKTNYAGQYIYTPSQRPTPPVRSQQMQAAQRSTNSDVVVKSRVEAEMVLQSLYEALATYESVSVSDLRQMVGLPTTFVDNNWGWVSLAGSSIQQTRDGWLIDLPLPVSL